jgi:hypothetical protein
METIMKLKFIAAALFAMVAVPCYAGEASDLLKSGGRVAGMASLQDGTIALTIQTNNNTLVCYMRKPSGINIETGNCYKVD